MLFVSRSNAVYIKEGVLFTRDVRASVYSSRRGRRLNDWLLDEKELDTDEIDYSAMD